MTANYNFINFKDFAYFVNFAVGNIITFSNFRSYLLILNIIPDFLKIRNERTYLRGMVLLCIL